MPGLVDDPRFRTQDLRARNQDLLTDVLAQPLLRRAAAAWLAELEAAGVPCAPINTFSEILNDPHVAEMGLVGSIPLPNGATVDAVPFPVAISGHQAELGRPPLLGEHDDEVAEEWLHGTRER
ncbi:hypothetical protein GCM10023175_04060 [Pseudonocardia xishanensis]|uniref:CoA transferase family III n=2 Tax=Pseudonocardia xishanensis TaxID=630995 RepID=A0ABP8RF06_9PSEU